MALDNLALQIIVGDLAAELTGAFVDHPFNLAYTQFALPYHSGANTATKGRGTLVLSLDSTNPFAAYSYDKFTKVSDNSAFSNILRRLIGTRITGVEKAPGERVLIFHFEVASADIDSLVPSYDLVFELFPQRPNLYLLDHRQIIIALFKEHGDVTSERYLARGLKYLHLPPRRPLDDSFATLEETKPYLSRATFNQLSRYADQVGFKTALRELVDSRTLWAGPRGLEPFHFGHPEATPVATDEIYRYYISDQRQLATELKERKLRELLEHKLKIAEKKLANLQKDLTNSRAKLIYKDFGQTLFLYQTECDFKKTELIRDGYQIPVDPKLDYVANANIYFRKYRKAKAAVPILENLLLQTRHDIEYLQKKLLDLSLGRARDILELKTELVMTGYIKDQTIEKRLKKANSPKRFEPHYLCGDHFKIGFGLNDLQNETLTFQIASPRALFFHIKDYPGSHIVLLSGTENSAYQELAAELAVFLSDRREGEVYVALVKDVKKNKDKKGLVNILRFQTVAIKEIKSDSLRLFKEALR